MLKGNCSRLSSLGGGGCLAVAGGFLSDVISSVEVSSPSPKVQCLHLNGG